MLDEGRQLPAVAVGRANLYDGILVQQVTSLSLGRSHGILQDAQKGDRPLGTASHRSQSIRPLRDLFEEARRPGVRRKAVRIQSRQQALQDLQPSQGHGRGKSQHVTFWETPVYSLPLGVASEDYHYEGDALRFTSALDGPLMAEDASDREDFCSAMEQEARMQRL